MTPKTDQEIEPARLADPTADPTAGETCGASAPPAARPAGLAERWTVFGIGLFLAAIIWAVFGQTVHHPFVNLDDDTYVYENPVVQKGVTVAGLRWALTTVHASNWHPLTWVSHMLDCQFYGLNAGGHHLTNVLLHLATTLVLFLVLRHLTGFLWRSAFVAAVFAIHPLRVESVAWIAERKDVLSGLFFLLTIAAYLRYVHRPWSLRRYSLVALMLVLALMSKPMVVTLPFVLLLLDYWPLKRFTPAGGGGRPWRLVAEKLPLLALCGAACLATLFAQQQAMSSLPFSARIGNALVAYVVYLRQMLDPVGLAVFYPHPENSLARWKMIAAGFLLLVISAAAVAVRRRQPWFLFGWLWYLGMLVPVIGLLQVGSQAYADRYTYLPQIGLYLALTWMAAEWWARHHRHWGGLAGLAAVILAALIGCARQQTSYWKNSESLWTHTLACTTNNIMAHNNLGNAFFQEGNLDAAILHYQIALRLQPDHAEARNNLGNALLRKGSLDAAISQFQLALQIKPDDAKTHNNFGSALLRKGSLDEAIFHFQRTLQIEPDYDAARYNLGIALLQKGDADGAISQFEAFLRSKPDDVVARCNLGNILFQKGDVDAAIHQFKQVLQIEPRRAEAHYNLANVLLQKGSLDEAIAELQTVVKLQPGDAQIRYRLGTALIQNGNVPAAITQFQAAVKIKPDFSDAQNDLAWELATSPQASVRNGRQAVELARRANELTGGKDVDILGTLAAAQAEAGQFAEAVRNVQQAIVLARTTGPQDQLAPLNDELKLYAAKLPFHRENK